MLSYTRHHLKGVLHTKTEIMQQMSASVSLALHENLSQAQHGQANMDLLILRRFHPVVSILQGAMYCESWHHDAT